MNAATPTGRDILAVPMQPNDAEADTIRDYLVALAERLWERGEGFSAKRPFGDSGWQYNLFEALGRAGYIRIGFDDDGYVADVDDAKGDELIMSAIKTLKDSESGESGNDGTGTTSLVVKTVAATLRTASEWLGANSASVDMLRDAADQVEVDWDGMCCPICEEVTCDGGCPLEKVRAHQAGMNG